MVRHTKGSKLDARNYYVSTMRKVPTVCIGLARFLPDTEEVRRKRQGRSAGSPGVAVRGECYGSLHWAAQL